MELWCEERGQGTPVLLLVHGFPLDHTMWREQLDALAGRARLIAPDLRGFGNSQSDDLSEASTMEQMADDLDQLLNRLQVHEPVVVTALSMGGYIAWQFWKRHARRLKALILCDTRAANDSPEIQQQRRDTAARVLREGVGALAHDMVQKLFAASTAAARPAAVEQTMRVMQGTRPGATAAALQGMAQRCDATAWLPQITCPCLLICGQHDVITPPEEMRAVAQKLPHASFVVAPHAGHMAPLEQPELVNRAIVEFLETLDDRPGTRGANRG